MIKTIFRLHRSIALAASALVFGFSFDVRAQDNSILAALPISTSDLNAAQLSNYAAIASHQGRPGISLYKAIHFVSINSFEATASNGGLSLNLAFLPCPNQFFHAVRMDFQSNDNYSWAGTNELEASICHRASMDLVMHDGRVTGNITIDNRSFELYDLSGGVQAL